MALTRAFLKGLGIEDDKVSAIIEAHVETSDGLKAKITALEKERDDAVAKSNDTSEWEKKYTSEHDAFESYKADVESKQVRSAKESAYRDLLLKTGVSEKRIASILRVSDIDGIELDDKGHIKGEDDAVKTIKENWADFITVSGTKGADVSDPPANTGGTEMTKEQFRKLSYNKKLELYNTDRATYDKLKE